MLLVESLPAAAAAFRLMEGGRLRFLAGFGALPEDVRYASPTPVELFRQPDPGNMRTPMVLSLDAADEEAAVEPLARVSNRLVLAPLCDGGELVGSLAVGFDDQRALAAEDLAFIAIVAAQAANAIALSQRTAGLREQQRRGRGLVEILAAAGRASGLNETLEAISCAVAQSSAADRCSIVLHQEGRRRLRPVICYRTRAGSSDEGSEEFWVDAIDARSPIVAADARALAANNPAWRGWVEASAVRSLAAFPIFTPNRFVGLIVVDAVDKQVSFPAEEVDFLASVAGQIGVLIEKAELQEQLRTQATTDPLTRLHNRRFVDVRLQEEISRSLRSGWPLVLLLLDVDGLKQINDKYGHLAGDQILKRVATTLKSSCRLSDVVGRIAGDEFMVILPETRRSMAEVLVRRLRQAFAADPVQLDGIVLPVRVSVGMAELPTEARDAQGLFSVADAELYRAKPSKPA
jgi:diguanylate cyclase (GGDEF)-like protein